ncbi:MAG TPA: DNA translocase FtsK [Lachnospiraceae bacterium]|nr:DNA translocase FtsK [Lachnospiraceae bacterium]HCK48377.1 DNA translocase FtsK [Lachnospiraceae bacterium]
MASSSGKRTSSSNRTRKSTTNSRSRQAQRTAQDSELFHEIGLIVLFVVMVILFCCNFGIIGPVGNAISGVLFGIFGFTAYIAPIVIFLAVAFWFANEGNPTAVRKMIAGVVLFLMLGVICDLIARTAGSMEQYDIKLLYTNCSTGKKGGGILAGSICYLLLHYLETVGTVLVVLLCSVISLILVTERSFLNSMRNGGDRIRELSREDAVRRRENAQIRRQEQEERNSQREEARRIREEERRIREEERRLRAEEKENEQILNAIPRREKKVSGVMMDTSLKKQEAQPVGRREDIHEIVYEEDAQEIPVVEETRVTSSDFDKIKVTGMHQVTMQEAAAEEPYEEIPVEEVTSAATFKKPFERRESWQEEAALLTPQAESIRIHKEDIPEPVEEPVTEWQSSSDMRQLQPETEPVVREPAETATTESRIRPKITAPEPPKGNSLAEDQIHKDIAKAAKQPPAEYRIPPLSLLQKGKAATGDSSRELKETAMRLQQTLNTFGVKVTITDISQGPSVTRYELQPEQGVKVSKIVGLADDIKLNLAATDIRIEAPIPGKAAIGIEVPNKENMTVALRDLLESKEFQEFNSNIAFAVGKDIAGKTVVADIAKMPHMLIAGATGSGKSVCINTLIMSILYKAHPDDVKLIMVDPKVVELSVYNGIPHLLIPVVTDPKKASAALHWGVSEMEDRYRKFADYNVRDLKGYNKKIETMPVPEGEEAPKKMPQIVIIVDELADLMMVCPGEVEESICRLAQLARAAGIHLIIATQRPSVDVITGLIKANMPSRVAFSVSSGVDSRTILDMNGAEKLLGKGDMLFYPQGYSKPARVQGAFVSDKEVSDVVDYLKNQALGNTYSNYAEDIEEKIKNIGTSGGSSGSGSGGGNDRDEYFEEAARFIIDKDKASIGMLQRVLKIGFNRAARIMDQLCEYGVVGEEEGTKPRKVLMSMEQFEQLLEEI